MGKALEGAAMLVGAVGMGVAAFMDPALLASPLFDKVWAGLIIGGISMEAGAIAGALTSNRGMNITTRQAASYRQIIYGEQRVGGVEIYRSTTGSHHDQFNYVIVLAGHSVNSIVNLYLDGRQVYWDGTGAGYGVRNGVAFGGNADGSDHIGPTGATYNFGGKVYCEARFGTQSAGDVISALTANDGNWVASGGQSPFVGGCTYVYLKVEYDSAMFPGEPEIRFTVRGKDNIFDPRTGTSKYSTNWALIVADVLTDTEFGLGDNTVNQAQLIAAANVCDEQVPLGIGGTESRYTCHWHYDTSTAPGDALQTMMTAAAGRLSKIGGQWFVWPAYWQGPSFSFDESDLTASFSWMPCRSYRELFNRVTGTYTAPNYPYSTAGDLYDANGWYNGMLANNFPFAFQPTNYPQYATDTLHGYADDQYLLEDGRPLPREVSQPCVLSIAQAQRVAKIMLLRNRQQGTGTFTMSLAAWQMQPLDVFNFTFAANGWVNKVLEVNSVSFKIDKGNDGAPVISVQFTVNETESSVYAWSVVEELTVYDVPSSPGSRTFTPVAPTNLIATSTAATALIGADGTVTPRIELSWDTPLDTLVTQIQVQYQLVGASAWTSAPSVPVANNFTIFGGVIAGQQYNVRLASLRANGAVSPFLTSGTAITVGNTLSTIDGAVAISGTLTASAFTGGVAEIDVSPFTATRGALSVSCLSTTFAITGLNQSQLYYVYYIDPTFAGGSITPIATQNTADFNGLVGYYLIGSIVTPAFISGGGTRYVPSTFSDIGTRTTSRPTAAYDGDVTSSASVQGTFRALPTIAVTTGDCIWEGFPSVVTTAITTLNVIASVASPGLLCTIKSGTTTLLSTSTNAASTTYTMSIPSGTNLNTITVEAKVSPSGGSGTMSATISGFEIWIQ